MVATLSEYSWNIESFKKEEAAYYLPPVPGKVLRASEHVLNAINTVRQIASKLSLGLMDAAEKISSEKGYAIKARSLCETASKIEKMLLLKLVEKVSAKETTLGTNVVALTILFGMDKIHEIVLEIASPQPDSEQNEEMEKLEKTLASLKGLVAKYEGQDLNDTSLQMLKEARQQITASEIRLASLKLSSKQKSTS